MREILAWKVAEFLIFSETFPRSLHFCVAQVDEFLRRILGETGTRPRTEAARTSKRLLADLQSLTITNVLQEHGLHEFLEESQIALDRIGNEVVQTTMFYPSESEPEEQQQQQTQQ